MAYIKAKNSDCVVVNEMGVVVEASAEALADHPALATGSYEIVDASAPIFCANKIIFEEPSE